MLFWCLSRNRWDAVWCLNRNRWDAVWCLNRNRWDAVWCLNRNRSEKLCNFVILRLFSVVNLKKKILILKIISELHKSDLFM